MKEILKLNDVDKEYGIKGFRNKVLNKVSLTVNEGDFISIMGPSGAGKSTLLNLISTLDKPTKGEIILDGVDITKVKNKELSKLRRDNIGFIFQDYNLLDNMNLMDNIALPLALGKKKSRDIEDRVIKIADLFGLKDHSKSSSDLLECLNRVNKEEKATIIMVTHDALSASYSDRVYILSDGEIKCQLNKGADRKEFYGRIIDLLASLGGAK